jgi:hypothetical protein
MKLKPWQLVILGVLIGVALFAIGMWVGSQM